MIAKFHGSLSGLRNRYHIDHAYEALPFTANSSHADASFKLDYINRNMLGYVVFDIGPGTIISPMLIQSLLRETSQLHKGVEVLDGHKPIASIQLHSRTAHLAIAHDALHGKLAVQIYDDESVVDSAFRQDDRSILRNHIGEFRNNLFAHFKDRYLYDGKYYPAAIVAFKLFSQRLLDSENGYHPSPRSDIF